MSGTTALALLALSLGSAQAFASPITVYFGAPNFVWHVGAASSANAIYTAGDFWEQDFTATGLASATTATLNLYYDANNLTLGNTVNINASINGTSIGNFVINSGDLGFHAYLFNFASIAGPDYDIKLLETNTVAVAQGSASMSDSGTTSNVALNSSATPEPGTVGMLAAGLGSLMLLRRRATR